MVREHSKNGAPGLPLVVLAILWGGALVWIFYLGGQAAGRRRSRSRRSSCGPPLRWWSSNPLHSIFFIVAPTRPRCFSCSGRCRQRCIAGQRWANRSSPPAKVSLRVRTLKARISKSTTPSRSDRDCRCRRLAGVETAEAMFEVDDYENYVRVQSEAALRNAATSYPCTDRGTSSLSRIDRSGRPLETGGPAAAPESRRRSPGGSHQPPGACAPEIAAAMLQRQQAGAIIAARQRIVEGAVGMVEMALAMLSTKDIVHLDDERKAAMVSNLLVVLCGERRPSRS